MTSICMIVWQRAADERDARVPAFRATRGARRTAPRRASRSDRASDRRAAMRPAIRSPRRHRADRDVATLATRRYIQSSTVRSVGDLLLRGGSPWGFDGPVNVLVRNGTIVEIGPELDPGDDVEAVDVTDRLLIPGLVEAHCHVDKTLFGRPWVPHSAGPALGDRIDNERSSALSTCEPSASQVSSILRASGLRASVPRACFQDPV